MGEVSTEGPLKVVAPVPVEFETSLCDATCREGDTLKLKAVLLGEPTPEVSWLVLSLDFPTLVRFYLFIVKCEVVLVE